MDSLSQHSKAKEENKGAKQGTDRLHPVMDARYRILQSKA
jgi:hypothetical protein